ncbi:hypothetical protein BKA69DRAFT_724232 [Paraphysoderma sedebokerense]|nr:hypothetical protein BKA69DRAFT_724232 [Paraphysoderma sedebokerense]
MSHRVKLRSFHVLWMQLSTRYALKSSDVIVSTRIIYPVLSSSSSTFTGYYSSTGSAPCNACPTGFECPGHSTAQPIVKSGYQMLESVAVVECPNPIACGPNNTCALGYAGSLCGSCQEGFYKLGRSCHQCALGSIPFIVTAVLATIGLWILIWCLGLVWNYILVFPIAVFFLQDLAFLRIFDLQWPARMDYLLQVASFMNFNWELAQMECIFPTVPWYFAPVAILCMPFLYFITDLIFRDIAALVYAIYAYFQHGDLPYRKFLTIGHPTNIIVFLEFSYFPLIVAAASLLDCRPLAQLPHLRLSGHVDFACYEGEHSILWPIGVAALVLYGLGIPSLEFGLEWYNRKASVAGSGQNSQAPKTYLGLLTFRYTHSNYYYFLFPHFRRLVTVLIATFTAQVDTATQAASTALWFFIAYLIQYITSSRKWKGVMGRMLGRVGEAVTTIWLHVTLVFGVGLKYMANHDNGGEDVLLVYVLWWLIIGGFILSGLLPLCELLLRRMIKAGMVKDYDLPDVTRNDRLFENGDGDNYFLSSPPNVTSEEDDPEAVRRLRLDSDLAATSRSNNPQQATSLSDKPLLSPSKSPADNEFSDTIRQPASLSVPVYSHSQPVTTPTEVPAELSNIPTDIQLFPSNHSSEPDIKNEPAAKDSNEVSLANQTNSMFQSSSLTQSQEGNRSTSYAVIDDDPTKAFTFGKSSRFSISTQSSVRSNINGFLNEFTANGVSASRQQEGVKFDTTEDGGNGQSNDSVGCKKSVQSE